MNPRESFIAVYDFVVCEVVAIGLAAVLFNAACAAGWLK